jgi:uncharacterized protein (DUF433 family)
MVDTVIVKDVDILGGEPVFRSTRVPFQALLDYLEHGKTIDHFLEQFPSVTREQAVAALEEAKCISAKSDRSKNSYPADRGQIE